MRAPRSSQPLLEQLVLSVFADDKPYTRADIEAATGLSRAVVTGVVAQLLDDKELGVVDPPQGTGRRGRPSTLYRRVALAAPVNLVQLDKGYRTRLARIDHAKVTWADADAVAPWSEGWSRWSASLSEHLAALDDDADARPAPDLIVAAPWPVVRGHGAPRPHNRAAPQPRRLPLHDPLKLVIPDWLLEDPCPPIHQLTGQHVQLVNDANLAALGEASGGGTAGQRSLLYVLVQDGVGAGLVIDGRIIEGAHGMTGELAHVQVTDDGPFCICGNRGCLATQTQDPRILEVLSAQYAHPMTWSDVEDLVTTRDVLALRVLRELGRLIGRALAATLTVLDVDAVVLDGRLGPAATPLLEGLRLELDHRCPPTIAGAVDLTLGQLTMPLVQGAWAAAQQRRQASRSPLPGRRVASPGPA